MLLLRLVNDQQQKKVHAIPKDRHTAKKAIHGQNTFPEVDRSARERDRIIAPAKLRRADPTASDILNMLSSKLRWSRLSSVRTYVFNCLLPSTGNSRLPIGDDGPLSICCEVLSPVSPRVTSCILAGLNCQYVNSKDSCCVLCYMAAFFAIFNDSRESSVLG